MREPAKNSIGKTYNYYLVLDVKTEKLKNGKTSSFAFCKCKCGVTKWVLVSLLKNGGTRSCGCYSDEIKRSKKGKNGAHFIHGHATNKSPTITYLSWQSMMYRCYAPNNTKYYMYGAVGIRVEERWHDFENFLADVGERPTKSHTLDRIDNKSGYFIGNVRWATKSEQAVNRKTTRFYTINGETKCLKHWAKQYNIKYETVRARVDNTNMTIYEALTKPLKQKTRHQGGIAVTCKARQRNEAGRHSTTRGCNNA